MREGDLTYDDFLRRIDIQDVLKDAGYHLNRRDGLRYPSYVRLDRDGRRVRGDKFIVTANGTCCFQPPEQKRYNVISFIKEHPQYFSDYRAGMSPDRLVNVVCNRLLHHFTEDRVTRVLQPRKESKPFSLDDYDIHRFNPQERDTQKKFYPYFKFRGIDLYTQYAFHKHFFLATKHRTDGQVFSNLAFPMSLPGKEGTVGMEERGRPRLDGSGGYKGKAEGSNSSEGLWISSPAETPLSSVRHIYWFESAYDAMAYYQLQQKENRDLRKAVFVSTGGNPTVGQMRGVVSNTRSATQHICFDTDSAGMEFAENLKREIRNAVRAGIRPTPERKPYLDSIPEGGGIDEGDTDLLPDELRVTYGKYEAAWEEASSMRSGGLCHLDDIKEQTDIVNSHYKDFRKGLSVFLGLDEKSDTVAVREKPLYSCKDWNEQLLRLREQEETVRKGQTESYGNGQQTKLRR